ncbi:LuxR family transcriptional regulator [Sinorhizobium saheli]|uniref:LuxR family transcriptional regulator n=1 Tax=Sinorhizobium saheli TaxID=36856 RepID=A0A178XW91_SINSA|nr:LuxR family transcriptional regulator [Sinorhizobium saheli]MQW89082.1 LuxR family transcriptional regulator [Sinorhizobium saheli]OAP39501.1 LuxR family transcriptional regulator [Sinorhizobium saheli]
MSDLSRPALSALQYRPLGAQSRSASSAAASCTGDYMAGDLSLKRDYGRPADDCGFPQVRGSATEVSDPISLGGSIHFANTGRDEFAVELGRFLDLTDGVNQSKKLFDLLSAFAFKFGCKWVAYGPLTTDHKASNPVRCDSEEILNYPDGWQERCLEMGYERIAPVIKESRMGAGTIRWSDVYSDAGTTEYERRMFDEAATFGLRSGITVPLRGPRGSCSIMSFARHCEREFQSRTIAYLQLAATHFHLRVANDANLNVVQKIPALSSREKECVLWVARGKSSWDIGVIMRISENTVNFHIKNVMRKLETSSRTVAAIKAITLGIIDL